MAQQFISPDAMAKIPKKFNVNIIPESTRAFGRGFTTTPTQYTTDSNYAGLTPTFENIQYGRDSNKSFTGFKAPIDPSAVQATDVGGSPMPTFYAYYDSNGNFKKIQPENAYGIGNNNVAVPEINANGELVNANVRSIDNSGFFSNFVSDFGPMLLAGLGANLFGGMNLLGGAGELAGAAGGATAADVAANNALAGANLAGYAGTDLAATLPGAVGSSLGGATSMPVTPPSAVSGTPLADIGATTSPVTPPSPITGTPLSSISGSAGTPDISGAMSANQTPLPNVPEVAPEVAPTGAPAGQATNSDFIGNEVGTDPRAQIQSPDISGNEVALDPRAQIQSPDISGAMSAGQTPYNFAPDITAATVGQMPSPDAITALKNMLPQSLQDMLPTTPAGWAALASGGGSLVSGLIGGNAAKTAAQTQADAATRAAQMQQDMFNTVNAQGAPYRAQGYNALNQIGSMLPGQYTQYDASGKPIGQATGSGYLTQQFGPEQFAAGMDPGYAFRLQQGQMANQRASNLAGGLIGGNALKGMQDYTQGMASQEYGNAFNRFQTQRGNIYNTLAGIAGIGQTAQGQANQMAQNNATAQGQLGVGSAAAQAAGQIGQANAYGGAATGAGNAYLLSQLLKQNQGVAQG